MRKLLLIGLLIILMAGCKPLPPTITTDRYVTFSGDCGACTEYGYNITCNGTSRCTYIDTNKDIYLMGANLECNASGNYETGNITINTSRNVYLYKLSNLTCFTPGSGADRVNSKLLIKANEIYVYNSTINGAAREEAGGSSGVGVRGFDAGYGYCHFKTNKLFTSYSNIRCQGGKGGNSNGQAAGAGAGGSGTLRIDALEWTSIYSNYSWYSGDIGDNPTDTGNEINNRSEIYVNWSNSTIINLYQTNLDGHIGLKGASAATEINATPFAYIEGYLFFNKSYFNFSSQHRNSPVINFKSRDKMYFINTTIQTFQNYTEGNTIINFTNGTTSWYGQPKLVLTGAVFREQFGVYFYTKGQVVNLSQYYPHNLTMIGSYRNISEGNLFFLFPSNVRMDIGNNSVNEFVSTGEFNKTVRINLNGTALNDFLTHCNTTTGNCTLPIRFTSDSTANLTWSNMSIKWVYPGIGNVTLIATNLRNGTTQYFWVWANETNASDGFNPKWNFTLEQE